MKLGMELRSRLRDNRVVLLMVLGSLLVATILYYLILRRREIDPTLVNNQILLFFLRNISGVLTIAILYVLARNLIKLWFERHSRRLGSKFKTKLVMTYIGLSLVPVIILFALATELFQGSMNALFDTDVSELFEPGSTVAQELLDSENRRNARDAGFILEAFGRFDLDEPATLRRLGPLMQRQQDRLGVQILYLYQNTDFVHALVDPGTGISSLPDVPRSLLDTAIASGTSSRVEQLAEDRLLAFAARSGAPDSDGNTPVLVVASVISGKIARSSLELIRRHQERRQVEVLEPELRAVNLLSFLTVTLVLLLISSWIGLYLARRITVPIQALAEGTKRIMGGDLDHRVGEAADDELGVLVNSFNQMTEQLQRNERLLELSHEEQVRTNQRLDEERAWIGTVLENVAAGVVSTDEAGQVLTCNEAALHMLGLDGRLLIGSDLLDGVAFSPSLHGLIAEALGAALPTREQCRVVLRGEWKTFEVSTTPLFDEHRAISGRVIVLEDLTELIQAQQLATWNEAARRIAHEVKNPLTPIKLAAERLLRKHREGDADFGPTLERSVDIISREVGKMKTLVDEFARFARMPRPKPEVVDVERLLADMVGLYRDIKKGIDVEAEAVPPDARSASFDHALIRSALANLLDNAIEATPAPGTIRLGASRANGALVLSVADTGPGISPEAKEKLFLPYFSTKGRGTGLGLSIVHRVVNDHHGQVRVDDNKPRGAVFTIELPQ